MSMLPDELVIEIMSRLPVKSLLRFKSVNKTWHSIISDPTFAKLQLSRSYERQKLLVTTDPPQSVDYESFEVRTLDYPTIVARDRFQDLNISIRGSCNGLVCLLNNDRMFIWNPTTGDYNQIPNPNCSFYDILLHGIGYNRSIDDYGVLFASRFNANGTKEIVIELYTLKTRAWRRIKDTDLIPESYGLGSGISWNGDVYWLSVKESVYTVICFDMVEEKFKEVLALPGMDTEISTARLGMYEKCLCVFIEFFESSFEALVLKMNENEVSYHRMFRYPHDTFSGYGNNPICMTRTGQVVMDSDNWQVYSYDPEQRTYNESFLLQHENESEFVLYQESLVSSNSYLL